MGLVFLALGVLLLVMVVLDRAFQPSPKAVGMPGETGPEAREEDDLALIAAVGLALALAEAEESPEETPQAAGTAGQGWTMAGRSREISVWRQGGRTSFWLPGR